MVAIKEIIPDRLNLVPTGKFVVKDSDILILMAMENLSRSLRMPVLLSLVAVGHG